VIASAPDLAAAMDDLGLTCDAPSQEATHLGGETGRRDRLEGGGRARLVPGFLVGAHALTQADRLLSPDRGFVRCCVTTLVVIDPSVGTP
jgi:hypothetical protein